MSSEFQLVHPSGLGESMQLPCIGDRHVDEMGENGPVALFAADRYAILSDVLIHSVHPPHPIVVDIDTLGLWKSHSLALNGTVASSRVQWRVTIGI